MKSFFLTLLIFVSTENCFAISLKQLDDCIYKNTDNVQTLFGLVQQLTTEEYVSSEELTLDLMSDEAQNCQDVAIVLVNAYAKGLQLKKETEIESHR